MKNIFTPALCGLALLAHNAVANTNNVESVSTNNSALVSNVSSNGYETLAATVTNSPVITAIDRVSYPNKERVSVTAINFNNGASFNLYKSNNLADSNSWVKVPAMIYTGSQATNAVTHAYSETNSAYKANSFFKLKTE